MAETITDLDAAASLPRLLAEVAAGKSFVITQEGVPVARVVPEPAAPPPGRRVLTPEQEKAWAETMALIGSLEPPPPPEGLSPGWPRNRDEIYDEILARTDGP